MVNIIFISSLFIFLFAWNEVIYQQDFDFDEQVFIWISGWADAGYDQFFIFITHLGNREFVIAFNVLLILYFLFVRRHPWYSLKIPVVAIGTISLNLILKFIFDRPRPIAPMIEAFGLSFPSGHAMMSFSFYGLLIYLAWINISNVYLKYSVCILLFILIHLIAFSRVYLRVHFATDVLAGLALGAAWLILSIFFLRKIEKYTRKEIDPVIETQ